MLDRSISGLICDRSFVLELWLFYVSGHPLDLPLGIPFHCYANRLVIVWLDPWVDPSISVSIFVRVKSMYHWYVKFISRTTFSCDFWYSNVNRECWELAWLTSSTCNAKSSVLRIMIAACLLAFSCDPGSFHVPRILNKAIQVAKRQRVHVHSMIQTDFAYNTPSVHGGIIHINPSP